MFPLLYFQLFIVFCCIVLFNFCQLIYCTWFCYCTIKIYDELNDHTNCRLLKATEMIRHTSKEDIPV